MLIHDYPDADAGRIRELAGHADGPTELFVREAGVGGLRIAPDPPPDGERTSLAGARAMRLLFSGGEVGATAGDWLFFVGLWTPRDYRDEFLAWYRVEHLPLLLECARWSGCRFVEMPVEHGCQFFAMHQMNDRAALESPQRALSRSTPWFGRLSRHDWFDGAFTRSLYRRVAP